MERHEKQINAPSAAYSGNRQWNPRFSPARRSPTMPPPIGFAPARWPAPAALALLIDSSIFLLRNRIRHNAASCLDMPLPPAHQQAANRNAGIEIPRKIRIKHAAAINPAPRGLQLFDNLHGANLGRARSASPPEARPGTHPPPTAHSRNLPSSALTRCITCE